MPLLRFVARISPLSVQVIWKAILQKYCHLCCCFPPLAIMKIDGTGWPERFTLCRQIASFLKMTAENSQWHTQDFADVYAYFVLCVVENRGWGCVERGGAKPPHTPNKSQGSVCTAFCKYF